MARISIHIVNWNGAEVLGDALDSLRAQEFKDFTLTVVDNASSDGSVDVVRERFPEATVLRNFKNLGACRAQNQAFELARQRWAQDDKAGRSSLDRYVLTMGPDVILPSGWLQDMLDRLDRRPEIGAACGKLRRALPRLEESGDPRQTDVIESTGVSIRKDRRAASRGAGETDKGQYDEPAEVFGVPGALALWRAEALDAAAEAAGGELFDEDFFAYEEDVDLAWRLRLLGWKTAYAPETAYRSRGSDAVTRQGAFRRAAALMRRSPMAERLSKRNRLMRIAKLDDVGSFLMHAVFIVPYEIGAFLSALLLAPRSLMAYPQALARLPRMLRKRRKIMKSRKVPPKDIRGWLE